MLMDVILVRTNSGSGVRYKVQPVGKPDVIVGVIYHTASSNPAQNGWRFNPNFSGGRPSRKAHKTPVDAVNGRNMKVVNTIHTTDATDDPSVMRRVIRQVYEALPTNRDWLDPDLEKLMKHIAAQDGAKIRENH